MFTLLAPTDTEINFKNILQETKEFNVFEYGYLYNGGGVSIGDLNNDGLPDIVEANSGALNLYYMTRKE